MSARGDSSGIRKKIGGLLAGWATVTTVAATFGTAVYASTGDTESIVVWIGFPTVIFTLLLVLVGLAYAATEAGTPPARRGKPRPGEGVRHTRRQSPYTPRR